MHLYFSAISGPFNDAQSVKSVRFDQHGGLIGRATECLLILDDGERHVSRQHAAIDCDGQQFFLRLLSEINTISVNNNALAQGDSVLLKEGDEIVIGPFVLQAHIVHLPLSASAKSAAPHVGTKTDQAIKNAPDLNHAIQCLGQGMKHPLRLASDASAEDFLKRYGEVMAELLEGTRKLTALRAESKSEYVPTDRTMVAKVDTNPIKHATSRNELFKMMFPEQHVGGLIDAAESVREVMSDLRLHEAAMQAGMRAAMQTLLAELEPAKLESDTSGFLFGLFAGKALSQYKQRHAELRDAIGRGKSSDVWNAFREGYRAEVHLQKSKGNPGNRT